MIRRHFLRISASWTSARFRQIAETIEILHENEDQARDHFSNMNISSLPQPTCKAYCFWRVVGETTGIEELEEAKNIGHTVEIVKVCRR